MHIGVILPVQNEEDTISSKIRSLLLMEREILPHKISVVVVDHNSTDNTSSLVNALRQDYRNIYFLKMLSEATHGINEGRKFIKDNLTTSMVIPYSENIDTEINQILSGQVDSPPMNLLVNRKQGKAIRRRKSEIVPATPITSTQVINPQKDFTDAFKSNITMSINRVKMLYKKIIAENFFGEETPITVVTVILALLTSFFIFIGMIQGIQSAITLLIALISLSLIVQSSITIYWMIYAWEHPDRIEKNKSPQEFIKHNRSFTALIPARDEKEVIAQTITSINNIHYPESLKETIVICREDDIDTIEEVQKTISRLGKKNISLALFNDTPINKPHALNVGLSQANNDIIAVFDAEDEVHPDLYKVINTVMKKEKADVIQSGVQLMNYNSSWFSALNVLEYFFWFKSTLQYFAQQGSIPLGGNTVFFKRKLLEKVGGWDEECLTEDADIGIRLSILGATIRTVYDEQHVTKEETPQNVGSFIKQRTRWNQGFLQILLKGDWMRLPNWRQRILALYILMWPQFQALLFLYIPLALLFVFTQNVPVFVAIIANIPLLLFIIQISILTIGLWEFIKGYNYTFTLFTPLRVILFFLPFQFLLGYSSFRALFRMLLNNNSWEKTKHFNAHRSTIDPILDLRYTT